MAPSPARPPAPGIQLTPQRPPPAAIHWQLSPVAFRLTPSTARTSAAQVATSSRQPNTASYHEFRLDDPLPLSGAFLPVNLAHVDWLGDDIDDGDFETTSESGSDSESESESDLENNLDGLNREVPLCDT